MNNIEIQKTLEKIKQIIPTYQIPEIDPNATKEEIADELAVYIMSFGELNYSKTLLVIKNLIENESKFETFKTYPIPTIVQEYKKIHSRDIYNQTFIREMDERKQLYAKI